MATVGVKGLIVSHNTPRIPATEQK